MKKITIVLLGLAASSARADFVKIDSTYYVVNSKNGRISEVKNSNGESMSPFLKVISNNIVKIVDKYFVVNESTGQVIEIKNHNDDPMSEYLKIIPLR
ncbi:MAG: hypothetical protein JNM93_06195 [Bacteriovoracaceae bacterium]|nr:hypothetical protein [Bacteriovoracaceae bacterium]